MDALRAWQARCHEAGYVGRAWPLEFGGRGRPAAEQIVIDQELAAAGAPEFANIVGLDVLGPSLLRFGTDEQRRRYIPPILAAEEIWCQGFSEPDAGSDLASLRTRAEERGDEFVVSGQKTWVSWGQFARWCGVLARTHEAGPKHRGISMLIIDMRSPGVELRPMTQITGHAEFCELFLDDVVVPRANLLGELGDGWKIAMHTLGHERGTAALPRQVKLRTWLDRAVRVAAERTVDGAPLIDDPGGADRPRAGAGRRRGPAPPRVPHRRRVPQRRRRRARQLERQAAHGRGGAAAGGDRARGAGHHARACGAGGGRRGATSGTRRTCTPAPRPCTAARSRSSATSSPTAFSRFHRSDSNGPGAQRRAEVAQRIGRDAARPRRRSPRGCGHASSTSARSPWAGTTGSARSSCA